MLSWRRIAVQEPAIQTFLVETLRRRAQKAAREGLAYHGDMFILAACYINGYGVKVDYEEAKSTLCTAADGGHYISMAYFYRICHAILPDFRPSQAGVQHICDMALCGCRTALEDLAELAPAAVPAVKSSLKDIRGGVGADWYFSSQMLYGLQREELIAALYWTGGQRREFLNPQHILDFRVNKRGDGLLHFASSCAKAEALEALLRDVPFYIDSCSDQGDTALLCAVRAGQVQNTMLLLDRGADVQKASLTGETPLHWLISLEGEDVILVGRALLERGAMVCATTAKQVAHSNFPATLETDRLYCGSPLDWAVQRNRPDIVRFLLDQLQDPSALFSLLSQERQPNPLERAAFYHHAECLESMIKAMEEAAPDRLGHGYLMKPLLVLATSGADLFAMALRHGLQWENRLRATFDLLLIRSGHRNFLDGLGNEFGETLLYHAIAGQHDTVVQYLLSPHVERLLSGQEPEVSSPTSTRQQNIEGQEDIEEGGLNHAPMQSEPVIGSQASSDGYGILALLRNIYTKIRDALGSAQPVPDPMYTITLSPPDSQRCRAGAFHPEDIHCPCAISLRPPILEAIRWNRKHIYDLLLSRGADPNSKSRNPFHSSNVDWTAIHTFAYAGHNADFAILEDLVDHQNHPVEGRSESCFQTETPLLTSIYSNSFNLSSFLLESGADINACSTSAGPLATEHPTTILGHIIASSANGSIARLRFLCSVDPQSPEFIVEPDRNLTALHRCAMANGELHWAVDGQELAYPEYNFDNNQEMMASLLERWGSSDEVNRRCDLDGSTAVHLAVAFVNVGAVQELLETGNVDKNIRDSDGATAEEICIEGIHTLKSVAPEHAGAAFEKYKNTVYEILHMLQE